MHILLQDQAKRKNEMMKKRSNVPLFLLKAWNSLPALPSSRGHTKVVPFSREAEDEGELMATFRSMLFDLEKLEKEKEIEDEHRLPQPADWQVNLIFTRRKRMFVGSTRGIGMSFKAGLSLKSVSMKGAKMPQMSWSSKDRSSKSSQRVKLKLGIGNRDAIESAWDNLEAESESSVRNQPRVKGSQGAGYGFGCSCMRSSAAHNPKNYEA